MTASKRAASIGPSRPFAPFITIEGGEGAGKGSMIEAASDVLRRFGYDVVATREPGGTPESAAIRRLVVERGTREWTPLSELLLLMADRAEHVSRIIRPALASSRAVLCDRFDASTFAYQGAGKGLDRHLIATLQSIVAPDVSPTITILLDVDPATGLARSARRLAEANSSEDRFEALDLAFHQRVRESFREQAVAAPERWIVVDANRSLNQVVADAVTQLERRLSSLGLSRS